MTSSVMARNMMIPLKDVRIELMAKYLQAIQLQPLDSRARIYQALAEMGIDRLIDLMMRCPCGEVEGWTFVLALAHHLMKTTAAIKRFVRVKYLMRKVVTITRDFLYMCCDDCPSRVFKEVDVAINVGVSVLRTCVHGSKSNPEYWNELLPHLDVTKIYMWHKTLPEDQQETWKFDVFEMVHVLQHVHKCPIRLSHKVKKDCKKYKFPAIPTSLATRLLTFMQWERYVIFCSSPVCDRSVRQDHVYRYCSRCKLARYCSEECQRYHWKEGHRTDCATLEKFEAYCERGITLIWCADGPSGSKHNCGFGPITFST